MAEKITKVQISDGIKNSATFGIDFLVDNQPNLVIDRLKAKGYTLTDTPEKAVVVLNNLLETNPALLKEIVNNIPYDNSRENWTGDNLDLMPAGADVITKGENTGLWSGILTGLGGLAFAIGGALGGTTGTNLTPQQLQQMQQQELIRQQQERERKQRNMILFAVLALVVGIVIVVIVRQGKKSKS